MQGFFIICCMAAALGAGLADGIDVMTLEPAEVGESRASANIAKIRAAGETVSLVQEKAGPRSFNIFGFFGCCYHCKHNPACTEKCMSKHNIENGSARAMSHRRLVEAAQVINFMQTAEDDGYHKHKPIKLNIAEGHGKLSPAPEKPAPVKGGSGHRIASAAATKLQSESNTHHNFRMQGFFHCAFTCDHNVKCTKKCLSRHHISMSMKRIMETDQLSQDKENVKDEEDDKDE
jgi:hypothetical protein